MSLLGTLLSKQDAEYIGLDELLDQMVRETGGTRREAAMFLARLFAACDGVDAYGEPENRGPAWYVPDESLGWKVERSRSPFDAPRATLMKMAETGDK
jgi:hypothetical protein